MAQPDNPNAFAYPPRADYTSPSAGYVQNQRPNTGYFDEGTRRFLPRGDSICEVEDLRLPGVGQGGVTGDSEGEDEGEDEDKGKQDVERGDESATSGESNIEDGSDSSHSSVQSESTLRSDQSTPEFDRKAEKLRQGTVKSRDKRRAHRKRENDDKPSKSRRRPRPRPRPAPRPRGASREVQDVQKMSMSTRMGSVDGEDQLEEEDVVPCEDESGEQ